MFSLLTLMILSFPVNAIMFLSLVKIFQLFRATWKFSLIYEITFDKLVEFWKTSNKFIYSRSSNSVTCKMGRAFFCFLPAYYLLLPIFFCIFGLTFCLYQYVLLSSIFSKEKIYVHLLKGEGRRLSGTFRLITFYEVSWVALKSVSESLISLSVLSS